TPYQTLTHSKIMYCSPSVLLSLCIILLFFQAEDGIRDRNVTGVQTCALPIFGLVDRGQVELAGADVTGEGVGQGPDPVPDLRGELLDPDRGSPYRDLGERAGGEVLGQGDRI